MSLTSNHAPEDLFDADEMPPLADTELMGEPWGIGWSYGFQGDSLYRMFASLEAGGCSAETVLALAQKLIEGYADGKRDREGFNTDMRVITPPSSSPQDLPF